MNSVRSKEMKYILYILWLSKIYRVTQKNYTSGILEEQIHIIRATLDQLNHWLTDWNHLVQLRTTMTTRTTSLTPRNDEKFHRGNLMRTPCIYQSNWVICKPFTCTPVQPPVNHIALKLSFSNMICFWLVSSALVVCLVSEMTFGWILIWNGRWWNIRMFWRRLDFCQVVSQILKFYDIYNFPHIKCVMAVKW